MTTAPHVDTSSGDTVELTFIAAPDEQEVLIAELDARGFVAFLQEDDRFNAYVPALAWDEARRAALFAGLDDAGLPRPGEERRIPMQDWNAPWEASIEPVAAGPFVVRASWHPPMASEAHPIELVIDPKMSFGTGHHESTRLMLGLAPGIVAPGMQVLDAGTGTGILAIAAQKLGAARVVAFDNDPWILDNARENVAANAAGGEVEVRIGELDVISDAWFDAILANIHKSVLIEYLPHLARKLRPGGALALAGLLVVDREEMLAEAERNGFSLVHEARENAWWAVHLTLSPA
ncbi:MAG: 50S ribosomal protein L11 methyltransferase [Rhodothermales bacterium]|nr:50S ribosomal protein L11 methyltransferase [Rhodothermales bacterium]